MAKKKVTFGKAFATTLAACLNIAQCDYTLTFDPDY